MEKIGKLRDMSISDIKSLLDKSEKQLFQACCSKSVGQQTDTSQIPKLRRSIARIKTLIREQEIKDVSNKK